MSLGGVRLDLHPLLSPKWGEDATSPEGGVSTMGVMVDDPCSIDGMGQGGERLERSLVLSK